MAPNTDSQQLEGLSPRVRGNRWALALTPPPSRSIPACAGEPRPAGSRGRACQVYPRVCGGTLKLILPPLCNGGLSPRVRGNQGLLTAHEYQRRSIPACAGEPLWYKPPGRAVRVYPRVCGGTAPVGMLAAARAGLSPRVRGNPAIAGIAANRMRSIPACAGEPCRWRSGGRTAGVYPRVCGGTAVRPVCRSIGGGLSPRVRGNRRSRAGRRTCRRSIPACAGEPWPPAFSGAQGPVYPRVCGGTRPAAVPRRR